MYYFKGTVKTLKIENSNRYTAKFLYCDKLNKNGIAYDNKSGVIKLDENQEFTADKEIFDFLCSMKDEKLLIGFDKNPDETKESTEKEELIEIKEVSLLND